MSHIAGHGCPECEKVVLNGDIAALNLIGSAAHLEAICATIERHIAAEREFSNLKALVVAANALEDLSNDYQKQVDKFRRMVLDGIKFPGPWPKSVK